MNPALIVCNDPVRTNRLRSLFVRENIATAWYPHYDAYLLDLAERRPALLVVDLLLPIVPKLNLIAKAREKYPDLLLVLIGKREYLQSEGLYQNEAHTILVDEIEDVPTKNEE